MTSSLQHQEVRIPAIPLPSTPTVFPVTISINLEEPLHMLQALSFYFKPGLASNSPIKVTAKPLEINKHMK